MAQDDKSKKGRQDDSIIDANDPSEMAYASRTWNVTRKQIREAIAAVGNSRKKVKAYLTANNSIKDEEE